MAAEPDTRVDDVEEAPLTKAQIRELERRIKDSEDRTRYLLVSVFGPRFVLYYNVSEDTFGMNDPRYATVFKRRAAAKAVKGQMRDGIRVVRCRVNKSGQLVLSSLPKFRGGLLGKGARRATARKPKAKPQRQKASRKS